MSRKIKNNFRLPRPRSACPAQRDGQGGQTSDFRSRGGFTLVEILVAIFVFAMVVTLVVRIFSMGMSGSQRTLGRQNIQDAGRFIMEAIAKEIRMSDITTANGTAYTRLDIVNSKDCTVRYVFGSNNITRRVRGGPDPPCTVDSSPVVLNPDEVEVTGNFYVQNNGTAQARVTILMTLKAKGGKVAEQPIINLQTTVSSRQYEQ